VIGRRPKNETGTRCGRRRAPGLGSLLALCCLPLAGCGDSMPRLQDLNPFAEKEVPLPGKRVSVIQQENISSDLATGAKPISLPPQQANESWS